MIDINITKNQNEIDEVIKIRKEVFIVEQGVSVDDDRDGLDDSSEHVIMYSDAKPVGCARIRHKDDVMKFERIAIVKLMRGKGLGNDMMRFLIKHAKEKGVKKIVMGAQYYLLDFYKKFGFTEKGDLYTEIGRDHINMYLEL